MLRQNALNLPRNFRFGASLGGLLASFGAQLGAKGFPKFIILAASRTKTSKNDVLNDASEKARGFDGILMGKT